MDVITGGIGGKIMDTIDKFVPDKDLNATLKHQLSMATLTADIDLQKTEVEAERDVQIAIEQTHQVELNQSDIYTKQTRPKIARQSWFLGSVYAAITVFSMLVDPFVEADLASLVFDPIMFGTLVGPALWYSGMRGIDKWKNGNK
jgi:hypothetical protein